MLRSGRTASAGLVTIGILLLCALLVLPQTGLSGHPSIALAQSEFIADGDLDSSMTVLVPPINTLPLSPGKWTGWSLSGNKSTVQSVSSPAFSGSRAVRVNTTGSPNGSIIYQDMKPGDQSLVFSFSIYRNQGKEVAELVYNWDRGKGSAQPGVVLIFSDAATQFNAWGSAAPNQPAIPPKTWTPVSVVIDTTAKTQELFVSGKSVARVSYNGPLPSGQATVALGDVAGQAFHGDYVFDAVSLKPYSRPATPTPTPALSEVKLPAGPSAGDLPAAVSVSIPALPLASSLDVPPQVLTLVNEKDLVELFVLNSQIEAAKFLAIVEAVEAGYREAQAASSAAGVAIPVPDFASIKARVQSLLTTVTSAGSIGQAQDAVAALIAYGDSVKEDLSASGRNIEGYFSIKQGELQAKVQAEVEAYAAEGTRKIVAEISASMARYRAEAAAEAGAIPDAATVQRLIQAKVDAYLAKRKAEVGAEAKAKGDQLISAEKAKLDAVKTAFQKIQTAADAAARHQTPEVARLRQQALARQKAVVQAVVDKKVNAALAELANRASDLQNAQKMDPSVKSAAQIGAELKQERDALVAKIDSAAGSGNQEQFKSAINDFAGKWQSYADSTSRLQPNAVRLRELVQAQLSLAREQLRANQATIDKMQKGALGKTDDESKGIIAMGPQFDRLKAKMDQLLRDIQQADDLLGKATADTPTGPIIDLLNQINAEADSLKNAVEQLKGKAVPPESVTIQAEQEASASVSKPGTSWDSTREVKPSWRSGWTGTGDWYLSRGGDRLTYGFKTTGSGTYNFWIRDWDDNKHSPGARTVTVVIDGKTAGNFAENAIRDSRFQWHMVGTVTLAQGQHTMTVTKAGTTSAAAILDAFFFTSDAGVKPQ